MLLKLEWTRIGLSLSLPPVARIRRYRRTCVLHSEEYETFLSVAENDLKKYSKWNAATDI